MTHRLVALGLLALAGCSAAAPRPGPSSAGSPAAAVTAGGVEVSAAAGRWRGWPADLPRLVTPVQVTIVNRGPAPLRVRLEDFALLMQGRRLAAVLPQEVRGVVYDPPPASLPSAGFVLGDAANLPERDWVMRGAPAVVGADAVARVGERFAVPSADVLDRALREGVLEPGGTASGFVYFERRPRPGPVQLTAHLVDARTDETVGRAVVALTLP